MARINNSTRRWLAFAIWGAGIVLFLGLSWWNLASFRKDAENRLINEAGRTAAQIAGLLGAPGGKLTEQSAKAIVAAAMEDESIYAVKIETRRGILEGQRRNYLWEPVTWDDEIAENCVQGINPIRADGRAEGVVEVWLSPRLSAEEDSLFEEREEVRFLVLALIWTLALALLFWYWGDFGQLRKAWAARSRASGEGDPERVIKDLGAEQENESEESENLPLISPKAGREFQHKNPDAWFVTAGMFKQTFGRAPALINRLFAEGEAAGLCHLGRMLELAAPCIGAAPLAEAARQMQAALNNPESASRALAVENCGRVLENTLAALNGKEQEK